MSGGRIGRVLIVAGSDSGGGAGIQADVKTVTALGGYAATAITAITVQNTRGVFGIHDVPTDVVDQQIRCVLEDIGADCVKIGMLHRADVIDVVATALAETARGVPLVLDPVMIAKGGQPLLQDDAVDALRSRLLPRATVLTPNLPEAVALAGPGATADDPLALAARLRGLGPAAVLVKGGHAQGSRLRDVLAMAERAPEAFEDTRLETRHTHGTGCTLASAVAVGLAQGFGIRDAVVRARAYVRAAILAAPGLGGGHGPLGHGHTVRRFP